MVKGRIFLLTLFIRAASASNRTEPCPAEGEFRCRSSGRCIPDLWLCDGARDCAEGEDEDEWRCHRHNHTRCAGDQPECGMPDGTFRCILHQWLCDGHEDCEDGSDERGCGTKPPDLPSSGRLLPSHEFSPKCSHSEFRCSAGSCISRDLVCDDVIHCPDGSDESKDRCATPPRIPAPEPADLNGTIDLTMSAVETGANFVAGMWTGNRTTNRNGSENEESIKNPLGTMDLGNAGVNSQDGFNDMRGTQDIGTNFNSSGVDQKVQRLTEQDGSGIETTTIGGTGPSTTTVGSILPQLRADSAFQPQIDELDAGAQSANHSLVPTQEDRSQGPTEKKPIEDGNQAPPDPFPFDLANYEIPEEEPEEGHDEAGIGTGVVATKVPGPLNGAKVDGSGLGQLPGSAGSDTGHPGVVQVESGSEIGSGSGSVPKAVEELQLASVLQFMSNATKSILKSINATKGHAVQSYKTVRNKSEVHSLSSYHHLPGLYAKLLPYEVMLSNRTESDAIAAGKPRVRRHTVSFRPVRYAPHLDESKAKGEIVEEENNTTNEKNAPTAAPIVPLQLQPLAGQPVPPIVPANAEENPDVPKDKQARTELSGAENPETKPEAAKVEQAKTGSEPGSESTEPAGTSTAEPRNWSSTRKSTTTGPVIGANEDPGIRGGAKDDSRPSLSILRSAPVSSPCKWEDISPIL